MSFEQCAALRKDMSDYEIRQMFVWLYTHCGQKAKDWIAIKHGTDYNNWYEIRFNKKANVTLMAMAFPNDITTTWEHNSHSNHIKGERFYI